MSTNLQSNKLINCEIGPKLGLSLSLFFPSIIKQCVYKPRSGRCISSLKKKRIGQCMFCQLPFTFLNNTFFFPFLESLLASLLVQRGKGQLYYYYCYLYTLKKLTFFSTLALSYLLQQCFLVCNMLLFSLSLSHFGDTLFKRVFSIFIFFFTFLSYLAVC